MMVRIKSDLQASAVETGGPGSSVEQELSGAGNLPQDATADPIAEEIRKGVSRLFVVNGQMPIAEFTLPNGRRADIAALDREGILTIVEIKSSIADFRSDSKWPEYLDYCDALYFAVKPDFPSEILPGTCGLILADRYGGEIVRGPSPEHSKLVPARRKALTLRFARTAALRLAIRQDPALNARSEAKDI